MIISCELCYTDFQVPDSAIGLSGRLVKCSICGCQWYAMPSVTMSSNEPAAEQATQQFLQHTPLHSDKYNDSLSSQPKSSSDLINLEHASAFIAPTDNTSNPAPIISLPFYLKDSFLYSLLIITFASVAIFLFTSLITFKSKIYSLYPISKLIYQSIGFDKAKDLVFNNLDCKVYKENLTNSPKRSSELQVTMALQNLGNKSKKHYWIRMTMFDKKMTKLSDLIIEKRMTIPPNKDIVISNEKIDQVPSEAKYISFELGDSINFYLHNSKNFSTFLPNKEN